MEISSLKTLTLIIGIALLLFTSFIFAASSKQSYFFPKRQVALGFYDRHVLPNDIPHPPHPLFWTSRGKAERGITLIYEYRVFHTQKYFSVDLGFSASRWVLQKAIYVASFFFVLRIFFFRTDVFSPYFAYSVAGPSLLSRRSIHTPHSHYNFGEHFIFQDFFGVGALMGKHHHIDVSLRLYHYSNGDLFLHNDGLDVPAVLTIGYAF